MIRPPCRLHPLVRVILIALLLNELRGVLVSAAFLGGAAIVQLTTGAHLLPTELLP